MNGPVMATMRVEKMFVSRQVVDLIEALQVALKEGVPVDAYVHMDESSFTATNLAFHWTQELQGGA